MADHFRTHIRESLADPNLQAALDNNADRRRQGRAAAFASLPDWQERRQRAHRVRAQVIARLDEYLEQFTGQAQANGMVVHRAADAAEALRIVLEIIEHAPARPGASAVRLVAKSKSMVTEEIELNHGLEAAGHRVVETDLGEYIVQLRGERPSHIITPAVHLRRQQVGQLFQEKLGADYTEDIPALTATARRVLREVFLGADVGISGVNFGVAETGTLCIVTNEGNGRMVTTLPPVHIALMGIERLVPTLDDLALMLSLLPRSATGQKLTVYTNLLHGPRRSGEADGPRERHLVLLDNGRSAMRRSPLAEALYCIRCGACLNACPIFREIGGHAYRGTSGSIAPYPGPIGSVVSPGLFGAAEFGHLAQASTLCGACREACPVDIDLPKMLVRVRAGQSPEKESLPAETLAPGTGLGGSVRAGLKLYRWASTNPAIFRLGQRLAGLASRVLSPRSAWMRLPAVTGWGYSKDFPRPALQPFRDQWKKTEFEHRKNDIQVAPKVGMTGSTEQAQPGEPILELAARFREEVSLLGGRVILSDASGLTEKIATFLGVRGIRRVQAWEAVPGLDRVALGRAGIEVQTEADASLTAGITGALAGIADTGTLVLPGGAGRPLAASLLPEIHIAVLRAETLVGSLPEALRLPEVGQASAAVLVTGPSRTADIEMTLTIGVHGPGELVVFLIEDKNE